VGCGCTYTYTSGDEWDLAAAVMTGFSVKLHDRLALDAGYRYLYLGAAKTGAVYNASGVYQNSGIEASDLSAHEFRVGLRWDIR
jgi:opacity protein-like surface antigen